MTKTQTNKIPSYFKTPESDEFENPSKTSFTGAFINDYLIESDFFSAITVVNLIIAYVVIFLLLLGYHLNYYYFLGYIPLILILDNMRKSHAEKLRLGIAHSIPFFADALANSLSAGSTLEQAFEQASFFLKGKIKVEFKRLILKNSLGKNLGSVLRELEAKFPNTGLIYLISLLNAYSELGIGISPLLKRISVVLTQKDKAEEKIRILLAGGSSYARLTIGIFAAIFLSLSYMMREQVKSLMEADLRSMLIFLVAWTCLGIFIVSRITSLGFTKNFALRPFITKFMATRKLSREDLFSYSGIKWTWLTRQIFNYAPLIGGIVAAYISSWFSRNIISIGLCFSIGTWVSHALLKTILKGLVEDQLIKTVETFPEILQVFNIGLNAGLNSYLAFEFAQNAIKNEAPKILVEELNRTRYAMECGEEHGRTWQRLAHRLPFETIVDFAEIMVLAPMHGESIVNAITQMTSGYQEKKLLLVEKKATSISQIVVPIIILAFLPLFLFVMFAPLITKIKLLIQS